MIGRKIYYDNRTGEVLVDAGERTGAVVETTFEQDVETYRQLSERNRSSFDVLQLQYGELASDFANASGYRVDVKTKQLVFLYPDPTQPDEQPVAVTKPLTLQLQELQGENASLLLQNAEQALALQRIEEDNALILLRLAQLESGVTPNV